MENPLMQFCYVSFPFLIWITIVVFLRELVLFFSAGIIDVDFGIDF